MSGHFVQLIICLIVIAIIVAFVAPTASNFGPEKQANAKAIELAAQQRKAQSDLNLKYEDIRRGVMDRGLAERDLKIEMDKAENLRIGELNTLNARYEAEISRINTERDVWHAIAVGGVILITGLSIAIVLLSFAGVTYTRNKAQVVTVGTTSIVLKGDQMFQPENSLDRYTAVEKIPSLVKFLIWLRIAFAFDPNSGDPGQPWDVVMKAREATQPRLSNSQVDYPGEVAQLRQAQMQLEGIKALARKMNSREAKEAAAALPAPSRAPLSFAAPEVGWLPALENTDPYRLLESEVEGR